jgi:hypothetical protein
MTNAGILSASSVAITLLAIANASGWLGVLGRTEKPLRRIPARNGDDRNDYRARALAIVAYLMAGEKARVT